jgi:hypothetical protein
MPIADWHRVAGRTQTREDRSREDSFVKQAKNPFRPLSYQINTGI